MGAIIKMNGDEMPPNGRQTDNLVEVVAARVEAMLEGMGEMKVSLNKLTDAVTRLALVEERQAQMNQAHDRLLRHIEKIEANNEKLDNRIKQLEVAEPLQRQTSKWVLAAVWGVVGVAASVAINKLGGVFRITP